MRLSSCFDNSFGKEFYEICWKKEVLEHLVCLLIVMFKWILIVLFVYEKTIKTRYLPLPVTLGRVSPELGRGSMVGVLAS